MPSLMTCLLIYQLSITPELRRHLRPFNKAEEEEEEEEINIYDIYELKQQQQQQQQQLTQQKIQISQKDRLQLNIIKKRQLQQKRRHWVLSTNLITILKQIKLTNPTFDIQQQQQQQQVNQKQQVQHYQKQQLLQLQQQQQQQVNYQQHLLKI